jgi:hypothetical protein
MDTNLYVLANLKDHYIHTSTTCSSRSEETGREDYSRGMQLTYVSPACSRWVRTSVWRIWIGRFKDIPRSNALPLVVVEISRVSSWRGCSWYSKMPSSRASSCELRPLLAREAVVSGSPQLSLKITPSNPIDEPEFIVAKFRTPPQNFYV